MRESIVVAEFNIADLFELVADAVPHRVAVVSGDDTRTYAELDERSTRLAHALDLPVGAHVGLCLRNSIAHVELMLACFKARAVPVNVNWRYTDAEIAYVAEDADLVQLWHDADVRPDSFEPRVTAGAPTRDFGPRSADDHYVLYTGGTTGRPKGVVWRQEDIFFAALGGGNPGGPPITTPEAIARSVSDNPAQRLRACRRDEPGPPQFVALALGPLVHASGQWSALGTLLGGGKLVLYADPSIEMDRVLALIEREQVGALNLVGDTSGRPLVDALRRTPDRFDTSSLLLLGSGGSMLSAEVKVELMQRCRACSASSKASARRSRPPSSVGHDAGLGHRSVAHVRGQGRDDRRRRRPATDPERVRGERPAGNPRARPARLLQGSRASARTFVEIDGARAGRSPATWPPSTPTAPCTCSAAVRSASTRVARRCTRKRSRRCSGRHRE